MPYHDDLQMDVPPMVSCAADGCYNADEAEDAVALGWRQDATTEEWLCTRHSGRTLDDWTCVDCLSDFGEAQEKFTQPHGPVCWDCWDARYRA